MVFDQSLQQGTFHRHRPRRRSSTPAGIPAERGFLVREGALHEPGSGRMPARAGTVPPIATPAVPLEEGVDRREIDAAAVLSMIVGTLSVFAFLVGFFSGIYFHMAAFFALASAVLGFFAFGRIRSNRSEQKGEWLALAGAVTGSIVLASYLGLFGVFDVLM
jgi:hypothetical protein